MPILKFLWYSIRPILKLEPAHGWWEIINILVLILGGGGIYLMAISDWFHPEYLWIIPAVLFFIAGVKLQYKLEQQGNAYEYALTIGKVKLTLSPNKESYDVLFELINSINKPMSFQLNTRLKMNGQQAVIDSDSGIIIANRQEQFGLLNIDTPKNFPSKGILNCELSYGHPKKLMFKETTKFDVLLEVEKNIEGQTILKHTFISKTKEYSRVKK